MKSVTKQSSVQYNHRWVWHHEIDAPVSFGKSKYSNSDQRITISSLTFIPQTFRSIVLLCALVVFVCDCDATLDLSNLDLKNFQYFRYTQLLPNGQVRNVRPPPPSIHDHFNRAKAGNFSRFHNTDQSM